MYFSFNFAWCSIELVILSVKNGWWGLFLFNGQSTSQKKVRKSLILQFISITPLWHEVLAKTLGIHLYEKLNFIHHIKEKISKANKGIGVIKKYCYWIIFFTGLLSGLIWIKGTSYVIRQTMKSFVLNLKLFNTMPHWLLRVNSGNIESKIISGISSWIT